MIFPHSLTRVSIQPTAEEPRPVPTFELPRCKTLAEWFPQWRTASAIIGGAVPKLHYVRTSETAIGFDFKWLGPLVWLCPVEDRETFRQYHDDSIDAITAALAPLNAEVLRVLERHHMNERTLAEANGLLHQCTAHNEAWRKPTPDECVRHILGLPEPWMRFL